MWLIATMGVTLQEDVSDMVVSGLVIFSFLPVYFLAMRVERYINPNERIKRSGARYPDRWSRDFGYSPKDTRAPAGVVRP